MTQNFSALSLNWPENEPLPVSLFENGIACPNSANILADDLAQFAKQHHANPLSQHIAHPLSLAHWQTLHHHWHADHTASIDTGITLGELNQKLRQHQQWLPCLGHPDTPIIDYLASDWPSMAAGINPLLAGRYPHQWLLGQTTLYANGVLAQSGGRVMKNVSGFDMGKLHTGAFHTYGLITQVNLRLASAPEQQRGFWHPCQSATEAINRARMWANQLPAEQILTCEVVHTEHIFTQPINPTRQSSCQELTHTNWGVWLQLQGTDASLSALTSDIHGSATVCALNPETASILESLLATPPITTADQRITDSSNWLAPIAALTCLPQHTETVLNIVSDTLNKHTNLTPVVQARPMAGIIILRDKLPVTLHTETHISPWKALLAACQNSLATHVVQARVLAAHSNRHWQTFIEETNLPNSPTMLNLIGQLKHTYDPEHRFYSPLFPVSALTPF